MAMFDARWSCAARCSIRLGSDAGVVFVWVVEPVLPRDRLTARLELPGDALPVLSSRGWVGDVRHSPRHVVDGDVHQSAVLADLVLVLVDDGGVGLLGEVLRADDFDTGSPLLRVLHLHHRLDVRGVEYPVLGDGDAVPTVPVEPVREFHGRPVWVMDASFVVPSDVERASDGDDERVERERRQDARRDGVLVLPQQVLEVVRALRPELEQGLVERGPVREHDARPLGRDLLDGQLTVHGHADMAFDDVANAVVLVPGDAVDVECPSRGVHVVEGCILDGGDVGLGDALERSRCHDNGDIGEVQARAERGQRIPAILVSRLGRALGVVEVFLSDFFGAGSLFLG